MVVSANLCWNYKSEIGFVGWNCNLKWVVVGRILWVVNI
jgi:hypothetical protein